jgi:hypothetical protein
VRRETIGKDFGPRPDVIGKFGRASRGGLEGRVSTNKVVEEQVEVEAKLKMATGFGNSGRTTRQSGDALSKGEVQALDEGSVDGRGSASETESSIPSSLSTQEETTRDGNDFAAGVLFDDLAVQQGRGDNPLYFALRGGLPGTKMSGECSEVELETIRRESRDASRSEQAGDGMDNEAGHVARAGTDLSEQQKLMSGITNSPDPLTTEESEITLQIGQVGVTFLDKSAKLVKLKSPHVDASLSDERPEKRSTMTDLGQPGSAGIFADGEST